MSFHSESVWTSLGGAFTHHMQAARAQRLFQPGLGATEVDDLALALGFPLLVSLGPDVDDPGFYARDRLCKPLRRLDPWPRNAAARAVVALTHGWERFPDAFTSDAVEALARNVTVTDDDVPALMQRYFELPTSAWEHVLEFVFLLEALVGGEAVLHAALGLIIPNLTNWTVLQSKRRIVMDALGFAFDRLDDAARARVRGLLEAVLDSYRAVDPGLCNPELTGVATRAPDLALNGRDGYVRSARRTEFGPDRNFDAFFLDRIAFVELTQPLKPMPPHTNASVQWLVQGGPQEAAHIGNWARRTFQGSMDESQLYLLGEWGRAGTRESAALLADMFSRSRVKDEVVQLTRRGAQRLLPHLQAIAEDANTPSKTQRAARTLAAAAGK